MSVHETFEVKKLKPTFGKPVRFSLKQNKHCEEKVSMIYNIETITKPAFAVLFF